MNKKIIFILILLITVLPLQVQASLSKPSASPEQKYMDFLKKYELLSNAYRGGPKNSDRVLSYHL